MARRCSGKTLSVARGQLRQGDPLEARCSVDAGSGLCRVDFLHGCHHQRIGAARSVQRPPQAGMRDVQVRLAVLVSSASRTLAPSSLARRRRLGDA